MVNMEARRKGSSPLVNSPPANRRLLNLGRSIHLIAALRFDAVLPSSGAAEHLLLIHQFGCGRWTGKGPRRGSPKQEGSLPFSSVEAVIVDAHLIVVDSLDRSVVSVLLLLDADYL